MVREDEKSNEAYWESLGKLSPDQKLKAFYSLYWTSRKVAAAGIRHAEPHLSDEEVQRRVRELFLYAHD